MRAFCGGEHISVVVFKFRVKDPRDKGAPAHNSEHVEYIGRRKGVVLNEGLRHGLFGDIMGKRAEEIPNLQDITRYIAEKTKNKTITYRAVISLTEENAVRLGYDEKEKWKELITRKLPDIADKIGIPLHRLEYVAAFHAEKGHPHVHLKFWDSEQGVKKAFVHPSVVNKMRIDLIKHVFDEEMEEIHTAKNEARKAALEHTGGFFDGFLDTFAKMKPAGYATAKSELKKETDLADGRLIYNKFPTIIMNELAADLQRLQELVPKKGRLNMKLMPPEVKVEIETFLRKILDKNVDCNREFQKYIACTVELSKYYSTDSIAHEKAAKSAHDEMMIRLSNVVLKAVKKLNEQEQNFNKAINREAYRRQVMENLVTEIFGVLARSASAENNKVQYAHRYGELSKQAKIELAKKYESDTGYDWER